MSFAHMNIKGHRFGGVSALLFVAAVAAGPACMKGESTPTGNAGTTGTSAGVAGTTGSSTGVAGTTGSSTGVAGTTGSSTGVAGTTGNSTGVAGTTGSGTGVAGTTGSGTGVAGTTGAGGTMMVVQKLCATKTKLMQPVLVNFENYDGTVTADKYSVAFGGATVGTGTAYAGPYGYPESDGGPLPMLELKAGHPPSTWAVSESWNATTWGMGGGIWMGCADASAYKGISFWVRGSTSSGVFSFNIGMEQTAMPDAANSAGGGTCPGTKDTCKNPVKNDIPLTADWTQVQILWADFTPGMSGTTSVVPNGNNITGLGWSVPVKFQLDPSDVDAGRYVGIPGLVQIDLDEFAFIP